MTEKIAFPPKPDGHTYTQTDGRTGISNYKVASLLKKYTQGELRRDRWLLYNSAKIKILISYIFI